MSKMAAIDTIPTEVFSEILSLVKLASVFSLRNCLLVSKSWCFRGRPLLYGNVVLTRPRNVENFCKELTKNTGSYVKSLTIQLGTADWDDANLLLSINLLPGAFCKLGNLSTFSLFVPPAKRYGIDIHRAVLVSLVDALPASCVNLEIDTQGRDAMPVAGETHLCDRLRRVMPRMQHVRLRLRYMCSALLGDGPPLPLRQSDSISEGTESFTPISLPKMRTLLLNCRVSGGGRDTRCDSLFGVELPISERAKQTAWNSLTQALEQLVQCENSHQQAAKLYVVDFLTRDTDDKRDYSTFLCAEMTTKVTIAVPCRMVAIGVQEPYLLRTLDGRELLSTLIGFEPLMEGEIWKTVAGGARLPAELARKLASFPTEKEALRIRTVGEWKLQYPRKSCQLWSNERTADMRLLEAEKREGAEAYLSRHLVVEKTPPGFVRSPAEQYITLFRSDDPMIPA